MLRDPIDSLKSFINVRHQKNGFNEILKIDINNTDFDKINDRIVYVHESNGCFNPDTNQKFPSLESIKALSDTNHWMLMYNIRRNKTIEFLDLIKLFILI